MYSAFQEKDFTKDWDTINTVESIIFSGQGSNSAKLVIPLERQLNPLTQ